MPRRSIWKGSFVDAFLLRMKKKREILLSRKIWSRRSSISPEFVDCSVRIYNGKTPVSILKDPKARSLLLCDFLSFIFPLVLGGVLNTLLTLLGLPPILIIPPCVVAACGDKEDLDLELRLAPPAANLDQEPAAPPAAIPDQLFPDGVPHDVRAMEAIAAIVQRLFLFKTKAMTAGDMERMAIRAERTLELKEEIASHLERIEGGDGFWRSPQAMGVLLSRRGSEFRPETLNEILIDLQTNGANSRWFEEFLRERRWGLFNERIRR